MPRIFEVNVISHSESPNEPTTISLLGHTLTIQDWMNLNTLVNDSLNKLVAKETQKINKQEV